MWTCPRCDRSFGRETRAHVCLPGMPIDIWLGERTDGQRRAAEAVLATVRRHRGVVVEAVSVGILIKRERSLIELRPKKRWLDMSFVSTATIQSPRIARQLEMGGRNVYFVHLVDQSDVDAELRRWLAASLRRPGSRAR